MVYDGKSTLNAENMLFRKSRSDHRPWLLRKLSPRLAMFTVQSELYAA